MNMGRQIGVPQAVLARSHPAETDLQYHDDEAVWSFTWELESSERPHGWFVISADCALEQYNAKVSDMQYEITMLNPGDSHLPADELGLPLFYYVSWLTMVGYGCYCLTLVKKHLAETRQKIHLVVKLLLSAYLLQFLSLTCEIIHLWRYMGNGQGSFFMDFVSELLEGLSSLVISFVLICLASGWTLVETEADDRKTNSVATMLRDPRALFKGSNAGVAICLIIMAANTALVFWNKASDDTFAKFHDHESVRPSPSLPRACLLVPDLRYAYPSGSPLFVLVPSCAWSGCGPCSRVDPCIPRGGVPGFDHDDHQESASAWWLRNIDWIPQKPADLRRRVVPLLSDARVLRGFLLALPAPPYRRRWCAAHTDLLPRCVQHSTMQQSPPCL
jgi:hypothetical protein